MRVVAFADLCCLCVAVVAALALKLGVPPDYSTIDPLTGLWPVDFGIVVPIWMATMFLGDAYSRRRFASGGDDYRVVLRASMAAAGTTAMFAYLINYDISRGYFVYVFLIGTGLLQVCRLLVGRWVARQRADGFLRHRAVVVGGVAAIEELIKEIERRPSLGLEVVGACVTPGQDAAGLPVPRLEDDAVAALAIVQADTLVVLAGAYTTSDELRRIGWRLQDAPIDLVVMPSLVDVAGPRIHLRPVSGLPLMYVEPPQASRALRWGKSAFDRLGAAALLVALLPVLVVLALLILVDSGRPVLFRHHRVGLRGRDFGLWKFRSMCVQAEEQQEQLILAGGENPVFFKVRDDARVTRIGRVMRKYSLDELPQLINVVAGEMSLVGPRPQVAAEVAAYQQDFHRRLLVRPGMTGLWQVSGRSELTLEEAMRLDLYYVDNWSMAQDLTILARTVRAVIRHDGAY